MNLDNVRRDDWLVGGLALLLAIDLLFFPWYSLSFGPISIDRSATSSPYAIWGVFALIALIAFIADLAVEQLSPQTALPAIGGSRATTRLVFAGAAGAFLVIKFIAHVGDFGWGFFLAVVASIALGYFLMQARNAASAGPSRPTGPPAPTGPPTSSGPPAV